MLLNSYIFGIMAGYFARMFTNMAYTEPPIAFLLNRVLCRQRSEKLKEGVD